MTEPLKRQTAYKFWIKDLLNSELKIDERGMRYFQVKDKQVVRVNILAHIINVYTNEEGTYATATLDDGSGQIRLKVWGDDTHILSSIDVGDAILLIGKMAESNDEIFLRPEICRRMETPDWDLVRKLELIHLYGKPVKDEGKPKTTMPSHPEVIEEKLATTPIKPSITAREKVVNLIESSSGDHGAEIAVVVKESGLPEEEAELAMEELLKEGEAYEPKPGFIKLIE